MESHECEEKTPIHYSRPDYTGNALINLGKQKNILAAAFKYIPAGKEVVNNESLDATLGVRPIIRSRKVRNKDDDTKSN